MKTIIVGIDGSHAAITAALWGVDEAISRAVPLRLVSVIKPTHPSPDDYDRDLAHAERSLREAQSAVEAAGKLVKIETDIPRGPAGPVLVEASRDAEMICVGSVGIGRYASSILGSTATELAEKAHCPVAVMRSKVDQPASDINWIVVRMTDAPDNEAVLEYSCPGSEVAASAHTGTRRATGGAPGDSGRRIRTSRAGLAPPSSRCARLPDHHSHGYCPVPGRPRRARTAGSDRRW